MTTEQTKVTKVVDISNIYNTNIMKLEKENELKKAAEEAKKIQALPIVDKKTYETAHDMQMKLLKLRTGISKDRKDFTEHLDEKKKAAIDIEKELIGIISPTEEALKLKKEEYEAEQERIKQEKAAEEARILKDRIDRMNAINAEYDIQAISAMTDDGFDMLYGMHKKRFDEAEKVRIERETRENKIRDRKTTLLQLGMYELDGEYVHDLVSVKILPWDIEESDDQKFGERVSIIRTAVEIERENIRKQRDENDRVARENAAKAQELKDKEALLKKQEAPQPVVTPSYSRPVHREAPAQIVQDNSLGDYDHNKYVAWLNQNGYETESGDFYIETLNTEVILWKKVGTFTL